MAAWRVQPLTVIGLSLFLGTTGQWALVAVFGVIMLLGAVKPSLNLIDVWISWVTRSKHQTLLYPKRFASGMGGAMLAVGGTLGLLGRLEAAWALVVMTVAAASLLAIFKICVGCWIYNALVLAFRRKGDAATH